MMEVHGRKIAQQGHAAPSTGVRLTLGEALREIGWLPALLATFVGAPSLLSLLETSVVDGQLSPAFMWIIESYEQVASVLSAATQPALDAINARVGLSLFLGPAWSQMFLLHLLMVIAALRGIWPDPFSSAGTLISSATYFLTHLAAALLGSVLASMAFAQPGWLTQGVGAALAIVAYECATAFWSASIFIHTREPDAASRAVRSGMVHAVVGSLIALVLTWSLSRAPLLASIAGIIALGLVVLLYAYGLISGGLASGRASSVSMGLTVLGGLGVAVLILLVDFFIRAIG